MIGVVEATELILWLGQSRADIFRRKPGFEVPMPLDIELLVMMSPLDGPVIAQGEFRSGQVSFGSLRQQQCCLTQSCSSIVRQHQMTIRAELARE